MKNGSLSCVGIGMSLGAHITPIAKQHIEKSDVCFVAVSDALVELWINEMHQDVRSLQVFYGVNKSRKQTYKEMVAAVLEEVEAGKKVCAIFYGHPGVFAYVPHKLIEEAKAKGVMAVMEPGISAEDCLFADLGIDPGKYGCQQFEATQLVLYERLLDTSGYVILWQIGVVGDEQYGIEVTGAAQRNKLLNILDKDYALEHDVILYEASTSVLKKTRIESIKLKDLPRALLKDYTTLVIPPNKKLIRRAN